MKYLESMHGIKVLITEGDPIKHAVSTQTLQSPGPTRYRVECLITYEMKALNQWEPRRQNLVHRNSMYSLVVISKVIPIHISITVNIANFEHEIATIVSG